MTVMLPQKTESSEQVDETQNKINHETDACDRHSPKGCGCSAGVISVRGLALHYLSLLSFSGQIQALAAYALQSICPTHLWDI